MSAAPQLLVTDDDDDFRQALVEGLARRGFHLLQATNGDEALSIMKVSVVDLFLLDMHMPKLNGLDTLALLRQNHVAVPVILMSAQLDQSIVTRAAELSTASVLAKPFSLRKITEIIEKILFQGSRRDCN